MQRRVKRIQVSLPFLTQLLHATKAGIELESNAPEDLVILRVSQSPEDEMHGRCSMLVGSESFPEIEEGDIIPELEITFKRTLKSMGSDHTNMTLKDN